MKEVTIQFSSILELIDFTLIIDANKFEVNKSKLLLTCELSEREIELARNGFHATILI